MDIQLRDKHLIYSFIYSASLSKILKYINMNISDIAAENLGISIEYMRC